MLLSETSLFLVCFLSLLFSVSINSNTTLHLLLTAELLWITLFGLTLLLGLVFNNLNLLSVTFFVLVFSAIEFGIGLVLTLIQNTLTRSINLNESVYNPVKFANRFKSSVYINRNKWKF